ncbi:hypothetical protein [Crocosphaera watsonii]|uniref:Uncharacterized protein n=2 Tax=Crocosphaera watsonii TaxID=263511 RepID=T2JAX5_CROWT|nr:hypothetical protein [Crocosphaera watsonii]CCQ53248.1 hypothetical protein CWATWH8502_4715 [Crocosphaera watsonii WH 8502]CCQ62350.1 hypothetical protein CWATWH0401_4317 [Crocosphaera watsonii WH 0401]
MKVKQFDCVEMKCLGSQKIYEEIKNMDIKEELSYWQEASQELVKMKNEKLSNIK